MKDPIQNPDEKVSLKAEDLSIGYWHGREALFVARQINFALEKGQLTGIVGVNGIGKSTLLRTLAGIQPVLSGNILLDGNSLEALKERERSRAISVVLTDPIPTRNLSVLELISLGRQPYTNWIGRLSREDRLRIGSAMETVGLLPIQYKKCYELSDGQLQKVLIARAIAQDTEIVLLDEPTTHLDLYHKVQILKLLQQIAHEKNKIILFTTHEIDMAIQLCDTMLLLDNRENAFGQPCQLIEAKKFDTLFPEGQIQFDPRSGSFKVNK